MKLHARHLAASLLVICGLLSLAQMRGHEQPDPSTLEATGPALPGLSALGASSKAAPTEVEVMLPSERYGLNVDLAAIAHDLGKADLPPPKQTSTSQIGIHRQVGLSPVERGQRFHNADGTQVIVFAVTSPGAVAVRLHFREFNIAAGDEVYVRGTGKKPHDGGRYRQKGMTTDGDFWSGSIEGDTAVVEYHVSSRVGSFVLAEISHRYTSVTDGEPPPPPSCHVDASCSPDGPKNAVGRITFESRFGYSSACTGTLVNNSNQDRTPYFMTAHHCIATQQEAASIEAYWGYQTTGCGSTVLRSDWAVTSGGATLLATSEYDDSTLIRFNAAVPTIASFANWDATPLAVGTAVYGLHHPNGYTPTSGSDSLLSFLRRLRGTIRQSGASFPRFYTVERSLNGGATEGGSSGSGLFIHGTDKLVGVLFGGPGSCAETAPNAIYSYGKFSNFYPLIAQYLSPAPPVARSDFNADAKPDLVWQNNNTGQRAIWLMNGTDYAAERFLPTVPVQWQISGNGDFNNDGNTDLVWQNTVTGQRAIWLMNGTTYVDERFLPTVDLQWQIAGTGHFNADGHVDLLWQNSVTGQRAIWLMNGTTYVDERFLPTVGLEWQIAATGDFNADQQTDIVWQNIANGQRAIWLMSGSTWHGEQRFLPTVATEWQIAGAADFTGDSHVDLVWQNTATGQRAIWLMDGTNVVSDKFLPTIPTDWEIRNR